MRKEQRRGEGEGESPITYQGTAWNCQACWKVEAWKTRLPERNAAVGLEQNEGGEMRQEETKRRKEEKGRGK